MGRPETHERRRWADLAEDLAGVGYWWMESDGQGLRLSPSLFRIFGFEDGEAPTLDRVLDRIHPEDRAAADEALNQVLEGSTSAGGVRVVRLSGEIRHIEARNACQTDADGRVTAVFGAVVDQTDHVSAQAELAAARDGARAAAAATADVLAGVNQALRGPLTTVLQGAAQLAVRCAEDDGAMGEIESIATAATTLLGRLDALLAVAGPRHGTIGEATSEASSPQATAESHGPPPGARVLIVDDHRVNRELARAMLAPWNLIISEADDGHAALAAAMEEPFDLILMDVRMPGLDGPGAVARIRAGGGPNRDTPILAFSADADGDSLHGLVDRGFDGVVSKPILAAELVAAVVRWVKSARPVAEAVRERA